MKAIILAAGVGSRMGALTANRPKCLFEIAGTTILESQITALRDNGISDIHIVLGHCASSVREHISTDDITFHLNSRYAETGMLESLYEAQSALDDGVLVLYGDTFLKPSLIADALAPNADFGVGADFTGEFGDTGDEDSFETAYGVSLRKGSTKLYVEGSENRVIDLSKELDPAKAQRIAEFIGVITLSRRRAVELRELLRELISSGEIRQYPSPSYLFRRIINEGGRITAISIRSNDYAECDYPEDLQSARERLV